MGMNDILSDTLVRIKNGYKVNSDSVLTIKSKKVIPVLELLFLEGFIRGFYVDLADSKKIKILLKYNLSGQSSLKNIRVITKASSRAYAKVNDLWQLLPSEGLGCFILTTSSKGVITLKDALKYNVGGELLCYVV